MIKIFFTLFFTFLLLGCNNLSIPNPLENNIKLDERTSTNFDAENEVLGIGSSKIGSSGTFVATGKASREAKDKLKSKILSEEDLIFKGFLVPADPYTRKILSPAIPDLMEYTANLLVKKAIEKDNWIEDNKVFIMYTITKNEILIESQNIFINYLDDITNKFQLIKEGVTLEE